VLGGLKDSFQFSVFSFQQGEVSHVLLNTEN